MSQTFRRAPGRDVSNCCTGHAGTTHFFQEPWRSELCTTEQLLRCTGAGLQMCGGGNIVAEMLQ